MFLPLLAYSEEEARERLMSSDITDVLSAILFLFHSLIFIFVPLFSFYNLLFVHACMVSLTSSVFCLQFQIRKYIAYQFIYITFLLPGQSAFQ